MRSSARSATPALPISSSRTRIATIRGGPPAASAHRRSTWQQGRTGLHDRPGREKRPASMRAPISNSCRTGRCRSEKSWKGAASSWRPSRRRATRPTTSPSRFQAPASSSRATTSWAGRRRWWRRRTGRWATTWPRSSGSWRARSASIFPPTAAKSATRTPICVGSGRTEGCASGRPGAPCAGRPRGRRDRAAHLQRARPEALGAARSRPSRTWKTSSVEASWPPRGRRRWMPLLAGGLAGLNGRRRSRGGAGLVQARLSAASRSAKKLRIRRAFSRDRARRRARRIACPPRCRRRSLRSARRRHPRIGRPGSGRQPEAPRKRRARLRRCRGRDRRRRRRSWRLGFFPGLGRHSRRWFARFLARRDLRLFRWRYVVDDGPAAILHEFRAAGSTSPTDRS